MNGNFLRDLSSGVFSRLRELGQQQKAEDEESKLQTISMLAGLADKVEPESLPTLMRHLGDTMGVKGKLKSFWSAFSGLPDRSVQDQLGSQLREITSGMIAPQTARTSRAGGDVARLFQPTNPQQEANRVSRLQTESDLQGKLIFRDPRAEKLEDLKAQSEVQLAKQQALLNERERLMGARQAENDQRDFQNAWKMAEQKADLKAQGDVYKRAYTLAVSQGFKAPTPDHLQEAAKQVAAEQGLDFDLLKARLNLTEAKIPLTKAQTTKAQSKIGRPNSVKWAMGDKAMAKGVETFERTKQALVEATARGDQAMTTALRKRLQTMATNLATKFGDRIEVGSGDWPYQKPRTAQGPVGLVGQPQAGQGTQGDNEISMAELQEIARRRGVTIEQARAMAQQEGLIVR